MTDKDIILLRKLLQKSNRQDLANLLENSYSRLDESSTYGSMLYSTLTTFEVYSPVDQFLKLENLPANDKELILSNVKYIYPLRSNEPEITDVLFFADPKIEVALEENSIKLKRSEIYRIVNDYIGVSEGYLGNFSYNTHAEFYPYYCDLDIDPNQFAGTTRERFIAILESSDQQTQAAILKGVLNKFPVEGFKDAEKGKKRVIANDILQYIERLEEQNISTMLESPDLIITNETVERAISDAKTLIKENGATSGIDRVHTTLHGYLKQVCLEADIQVVGDPTITQLYKKLREEHPKLNESITRKDDIDKILRVFASVMDVLNPIRNMASVAHPNEKLLEEAEAELVINGAHTILHYLNSKFKQ